MKFKTISLRTIQGFKRVELLKLKGWRVASVGIDNILMVKGVSNKY